jgi:hypothetical protein
LQDQDGDAVHGAGAFLDREVEFAEEAVGLCGGEALVPEVDGQGEFLAQVFGEELSSRRRTLLLDLKKQRRLAETGGAAMR